MEIKQGYKQTEVGIVPEEWEVKKLEDICKFSKGKGISKSDITEEGIECIRYGELYTTYKENITQIFSRTNLAKENLILSEKNDVIIPSSGETAIDIAKASCVSKDNVALGGDLNILKSNQSGVFLSYFLNNIAKKQISSFAQGVSVVHLYAEQLKQVKVAIPSLKEQEKIAEILSTYDKAIEQQELLIEKEREFKKGMMQKIFSQEVRFKDNINRKDYPEWEEYKYKKIFKVNQGLQIAIENRYLNYAEGRFLYITNEFLKKDSKINYYIQNPKESVICNEDDILMTRTGNTGEVLTNVKGVFHNNFFKIEYDREVFNKNFIYYLLTSRRVKNLILRLSGSSTIPDLNHNDFYSIKSKFPIRKEQEKIANFLSDIDNKIELLKKKLELLKIEKKGMMQKLLTGEVRV